MVFSGFRFCLAAREMGKPVAAVNLGRTRADEMLSLKVVSDCGRRPRGGRRRAGRGIVSAPFDAPDGRG